MFLEDLKDEFQKCLKTYTLKSSLVVEASIQLQSIEWESKNRKILEDQEDIDSSLEEASNNYE